MGYCLEAYDIRTCGYFLLSPYDGDELDKALRLCAEWVEQNKKYGWKGI
jgi:hypothetical protein